MALTAATLAGLPAGRSPGCFGGRRRECSATTCCFRRLPSLAGAAMAGVGLLISVSSRSAVQAQGAAVFTWFALRAALRPAADRRARGRAACRPSWLAAALVANPVDAARVLGVLALEPDLYLLGPAGAFLTAELSRSGAALVLGAALLFWASAPLVAAVIRFQVPGTWRPRRSASADLPGERHARPLTHLRKSTVTTEEVTLS